MTKRPPASVPRPTWRAWLAGLLVVVTVGALTEIHAGHGLLAARPWEAHARITACHHPAAAHLEAPDEVRVPGCPACALSLGTAGADVPQVLGLAFAPVAGERLSGASPVVRGRPSRLLPPRGPPAA